MFQSLFKTHRQVLQLVEADLKWQKYIWWRKDILVAQKRPGIWE